MKKLFITLFFGVYTLTAWGVTRIINTPGFFFSPATITINQGDDILFDIGFEHNAVEVSKATWDNSGATPLSGGFSLGFGGGSVPASQLGIGTHYYVCQPHVSSGMKGRIIVQSASGLIPVKADPTVSFTTGSFSSSLKIQLNQTGSHETEIKLFNIQGKQVDVLFKKAVISGYFTQSFDMTGLFPSGIYFVQIITDERKYVKKIVIL